MGAAANQLSKILLAGGLLLASCETSSEALFRDAQRALASDDLETAARLFKEVSIGVQGQPLAARAHFELAQMYYLRLRDMDAARDSLLKILRDHNESPVEPSARRLLAQLYDRELNAPDRALEHYEELLSRGPDLDSGRSLLLAVADCHYRLDELVVSADTYRRVLDLPYHPDTDAAYLRLATIEWLQGSAEESLRLLRELQSTSRSDATRYEALTGEIELLARLGRFSEATSRLGAAEADHPDGTELQELASWVRTTRLEHESLDSDGAALEELQKTIRWGSGRRRRVTQSSGEP